MSEPEFLKCDYCEKEKPAKEVRVWEKTDELVCYDCRQEMLDAEFEL